MTEQERSNYVTGFITGVVIMLTFRVLWWLIKVLWRVLAFCVGGAIGLFQGWRSLRRMKALEAADHMATEGQCDEAIAVADRVLASGDRRVMPSAWYSRGFALEEARRWDEAIDAYEHVIATGDPELVPLATLGKADVLYYGWQSRAEAEAIYRSLLLSENQTNADASARQDLRDSVNASLASLLYEEERHVESADLCRRLLDAALAGSRDAQRYAVGLARNLARQGRLDDALAVVEAVGSASSDDGTVELGDGQDRRPLFRAQSVDEVVKEIESSQGVRQAV